MAQYTTLVHYPGAPPSYGAVHAAVPYTPTGPSWYTVHMTHLTVFDGPSMG